MHLSAAIPGDDPGEPPVIRTTTFTNSPYPKPRLFNKKLPTPLPGGKDVCSTKSKGAYISKEFYYLYLLYQESLYRKSSII